MKKVVVTGGSGLLGKWVLKEFVNSGYHVVNADVKKPDEAICDTVIVDLTDLGEVYGVLQGAEAVIHLAAIPVAYSHPNEVTFKNNTMATYNILEAAAGLGIQKAVLASSESSYGICFAEERFDPQYVPIDEEHPQLPEDSYGLSKIVNEETAKMIHRRTGMQVVSFRLGNVIAPPMYANFPSFIHDASQRDRILWSYIDTRDAAAACRMAVEKDGLGAVELNLASDDTSMDIPSRELMKAEFPNVPFKEEIGEYDSLLSSKKAKELLGWQPVHFWRDNVK
ncbi:NAD-dependent epimerase/dehydratase family protein [Alkalicoccus daliensis]|uniref:Nucleoside-diphosphate-sugar epimerase n=1 Tax=Alkalicoccus daliensis TaxID=745820 RepID=A0A1H0GYK9_9BACI|nr:NAD(P)-dependent oxidoreductase [Alkalicoccus daliensis]SDO11902.1 Nucleoside-diphosphate-sugar epimerase [Alkalicoccus daliensis]